MQGTNAKTSTAGMHEYKNWHAMLAEPHMMLIVEDGAQVVQGVHSVLMYETSRKGKEQYAGKYLDAVGERHNDGRCLCVKTSNTHTGSGWRWTYWQTTWI